MRPRPVTVQLTVLGALWTAVVGVFYSALGLSAKAIPRLHPGVIQTLGRLAGVVMIGLGLVAE